MKTRSQRIAAKKARGRPPHDVARTPSGQPSRKADPAVLAPVLRAQCLRHGLPPTEDNMALMADPRTRTPWGLAVLAGHITDRDAAGIVRYLELRQRYLRCIGAPYEHPQLGGVLSASVGGAGGASLDCGRDDDAEQEKALRARYDAAVQAMVPAGMIASSVIDQMAGGSVPRGQLRLAAMRSAARLLAGHFGLE